MDHTRGMFVRVKERANGKQSIQIVESYRRGDNVSQKIMRHVGQAENPREVEELKRLAESIIMEMKQHRQPVLPLFDPQEFYSSKTRAPAEDTVRMRDLKEEQRIIEGIGEVFGKLYRDLGMDRMLGGALKDRQWNAVLEQCVLARIANPSSKLRTASLLEQDYAIKLPVEKIYRMMDHVGEQIDRIKAKVMDSTMTLFNAKIDVLFFDVTTLYFESITADALKGFGYSKDCKFKEVQVVLALITTTEGIPITYELFPGNTYEGHTLVDVVVQLKKQFDVRHVVLVADRAMFNEDNLQLLESESVNYIVAAKLKSLPRTLKRDILNGEHYHPEAVADELHWIGEHLSKGRRLIVSYSSERARKDASDRQRLVDRLLKKVKNGKISITKIIPNHGTKRFLKIVSGEARLNTEKIATDAEFDGLHGVLTNFTGPAREVLTHYRNLWEIEEAFRLNKHDLKMRPIYHWTPHRIQAHIAICFLAYALVKQALYRISRQQMTISFEQLRNELLHAQSSLVVDTVTRKRYILPSKVTPNQKRIYHVFGLKRSDVPYNAP